MEADEVAAAILVQTVFNSVERLRNLLKMETVKGPNDRGEEATANFLKPWYAAMLKMVSQTPR
jgi:hypothetical protein